MDGDQAMSSLWYVLALVLVGSALLARRAPTGGLLRMAVLWIVIFAILLGLFKAGEKFGLFSSRIYGEGGEAPSSSTHDAQKALPSARVEGQALRIPVAPDGHYWVEGMVNGNPTRFLIDSGASVTALSVNAARTSGLNFDLNAPGLSMMTANGKIDVKRSTIATLVVGPIRASDLDIVVSPAFGEVNVIGMNMLSRLKSWSVQNGEMVLTP
ncbi:TIGR02281 family clan AA aspartic protease [Sphingobium indicum]|uniref:Aspartyl protease n=3 Tax=Sphingobium indicum TaxID=332055 RepID=A0A8E1C3F6_9SPHN|nr:TIGR02281 family clan AA aspartic protease [Sphingobium indicum]EPR09832.1 aspartyl protease [Sphingobium indicum IP26]EQB04960.1 aspartyl protease [Sphingobium sp. HDIP04]KEY99382.1 aspartyl protease [Sphingomonas sp. BHC-A]APL94148.1 aspartyl protease [Sphingobium indicum B90A]KER37220.1 aspartyl protease [Sphingobium indicum F2]